MADEVSVLVEGGKASAGPPLGPALGPLGVNVGQVVAKINEETRQFAGMRVPVVVRVDPANRSFTLVVGRPPVAALLLKEVEPLLVPKITVEGFVEGAIVELISGPFKGEKARVKKIDQAKEEITVELIEAVVPIPVTVRGDHVRMLEKGGGKSGG